MNYGEIKTFDIANGLGVRVSLFVSGCRHHCRNCFNQVTWDFKYGKEYTKETSDYILDCLSKDYIEGLTILGGEPFEPENQPYVLELVKRVRKELPNKTIWIYSGFVYEEITGVKESRSFTNISKEILNYIDVLVDGRFVEELKNIMLRFCGSSNQRVIDVKQTIANGKIELLKL